MFLAPFQTDLRITNHREHKFPPSLTLLSVQNSNRMASRLTAVACFPGVIFSTLAIFKATSKLFNSRFSWINHSSLPRIAANEIASFCIDNRLREMVFFVFAKVAHGTKNRIYSKFDLDQSRGQI